MYNNYWLKVEVASLKVIKKRILEIDFVFL